MEQGQRILTRKLGGWYDNQGNRLSTHDVKTGDVINSNASVGHWWLHTLSPAFEGELAATDTDGFYLVTARDVFVAGYVSQKV